MDTPLYIGIDAGGTKTALCARASADDTITLQGPGTNLRRDGMQATVSTLVKLTQHVPHIKRYGSNSYLCAGVAGAANKAEHEALKQELAIQLNLPPSHVQIRADASVAYYAANKDRSGILVITGTGSIIWARTKTGQMVRAGGWGALLGDEGGGFQIGLAALRALSHEIDGGPTTTLSETLCTHLGICNPSTILDFAYQEKEKIPSLAPFVLQAAANGDNVALQIVDSQISALTENLSYLLIAHPHIALKLVYMGGLTHNTFYAEKLQRAFLTVHPDLSITPLSKTPAQAALELARKMG